MEKSFRNRMLKEKNADNVVYKVIYSDDTKGEISNRLLKRLNEADDVAAVYTIEEAIKDGISFYFRANDYDSVETGIKIGLIFKAEDVNTNNRPCVGTKPLNNIVDVVIQTVHSCSNDKVVKTLDYRDKAEIYHNYATYNEFVQLLEAEGFTSDVPKSFEELLVAMGFGMPLTFHVSLDLYEKEEPKILSRK